jgi:PAS domain S-box-containing protein
VLLIAGGRDGHAQRPSTPTRAADSLSAAAATSILEARRDADEDWVPDRVGDTVTVRGRVSVRAGALPDSQLVFIQNETAGIAVSLSAGPPVRRGDSLRATGIIRHQYGLTRLQALHYARLGTMTRDPQPTPLTVSAANSEAYEGQLVRIRARVVANRSNDGGRYLLIEDRIRDATERLAVFVPARRLSAFPLDHYDKGSRMTVTGVLSQYDYAAPYDAYYQVLPRDEEDLTGAGFMTTYYRTVIVLVVAGALLAIIVVFTLRAAVNRRTEQLVESRSRFQRLAEATFEGIIIHEDGDILDVNRALTDMLGGERDELVGEPFLDVLAESTRDLDRTVGHAGPDEPYEAVVVRSDGSTFPAEIEEKAVDAPERAVRVVAIRDVTERKKWEQEILRAKEEAEEMAQLKSSLLNNMSHELRTPITSIIGYAELILNEPDTDHEDFALRIQESGQRLSRTLRAVLEMAQVESGTLEVTRTDVDVRLLVRKVVDRHRSTAEQKDLTLQTQVRAPDGSFYTDLTLVRRILDNLVHNALKFTEEGQVEVEVETDAGGMRLAVSDTGIGIAPDFREQLFDPFTQESAGRSRTHEGTGLGLALADRMVALLGGDVEVESVKGEGTTVVVWIPLSGDTEESRAGVESKPA